MSTCNCMGGSPCPCQRRKMMMMFDEYIEAWWMTLESLVAHRQVYLSEKRENPAEKEVECI